MLLHVYLLGRFQAGVDEGSLVEIGVPRLQALLAHLVMHRDRPQLRQQLAFLLWPESTEEQARTNLRKLLMQLRRTYPSIEALLNTEGQFIGWKPAVRISSD